MSDQSGNPGNNRHPSVVGAIAEVSKTLIGALPPTFLALCLLNAVFLVVFAWFLAHVLEVPQNRDQQRSELIAKMLDRCLVQQNKGG